MVEVVSYLIFVRSRTHILTSKSIFIGIFLTLIFCLVRQAKKNAVMFVIIVLSSCVWCVLSTMRGFPWLISTLPFFSYGSLSSMGVIESRGTTCSWISNTILPPSSVPCFSSYVPCCPKLVTNSTTNMKSQNKYLTCMSLNQNHGPK